MAWRSLGWTALARLLFVVAVVAQLAGGAAPMRGGAVALTADGTVAAAICHAGTAPAKAPGHRHQPSPCPACCLMHCGGAQVAILGPMPAVPAPSAAARVVEGLQPGARAPPAAAGGAPYPRGPPILA